MWQLKTVTVTMKVCVDREAYKLDPGIGQNHAKLSQISSVSKRLLTSRAMGQ